MSKKNNPIKVWLLLALLAAILNDCSKSSNNSNNSGGGNQVKPTVILYRGALVGSTGYLSVVLNGNNSYVTVKYVDSSQTPVVEIEDSLTTTALASWTPGSQGLANVLFTSTKGTGITVTLVTVDADGLNPELSIKVPNDPYVKACLVKTQGTSYPLQVYQGTAIPAGQGIAGGGGSCPCYSKTINFVVNPAYIDSPYAAVTAIYIDSASHLAGFINGTMKSAMPGQVVTLINNNDTTGLHLYNGNGGPNSNNGSGPLTGSLSISNDGGTITGNLSHWYKPWGGPQSGSCAYSYNIVAKRVQ